MNKAKIDLLVQDKLTAEEAREVLLYFQKHPEELNDILKNDWDNTDIDGAVDEKEKMLSEIWSRIAAEEQMHVKKRPSFVFIRYGIAAMVIGLFIAFGLKYSGSYNKETVTKNLVKSNSIEWLTITNYEEGIKEIALKDGSFIKLEKNGVIKFSNLYDSIDRKIWLTGKAYFDVAKNEQIPFVVNTTSLSTTALGTSFTINSQPGDIVVQLHTGTIAIRFARIREYKNDSVKLQPGETFEYSVSQRTGVKKSKLIDKQHKIKHEVKTTKKQVEEKQADGSIQFDNSPLTEVFDLLSTKYKIKIEYEDVDIQGKFFTGKILAADSVETILNIIVQMNGLVILKTESGYLIKK